MTEAEEVMDALDDSCRFGVGAGSAAGCRKHLCPARRVPREPPGRYPSWICVISGERMPNRRERRAERRQGARR